MGRFRIICAWVLAMLAFTASAGVARASNAFIIRGGGYGHGIGMSQYGAYGYALHGKDYRFILAHYYQGTALGTTSAGQVVRVLLKTGSASFSGASAAGKQKLNPSLTYDVKVLPNGTLELDQNGHKVADKLAAPVTVTGPGPLTVAGLGQYRGSLEFRPDGSGGVETVNALDLEDYVRGVISGEMPASWSAEALKAQAVAARTYAITTTVGGAGFDLYPDTRSQMYGGVSAETPSTDAAVAATHDQVVTYNGQPVVTYFFSSSGGYTENVENVWIGATPEPWLHGVPDPYDGAGGNPYHRWGSQMTLGAASLRLGRLVKGQLIGIRITKHGVSPRILQAQVVATKGSTTVTGAQLQQSFRLLTTYAAFTSITTSPGLPGARKSVQVRLFRAVAGARSVSALLPQVRALPASAPPAIHGLVFPAPRRHGFVLVQVRGSHGWRTIKRVRLTRAGAYWTRLPGAGSYRIVYRGLYGPVVGV